MVLPLANATMEVLNKSSAYPSVYTDLPFHDPILPVSLSFLFHFALFFLVYVPHSMRPAPSATSPSPSTVVVRNYMVSTVHSVIAIVYVLTWFCLFSPDLSSVPRGLGGGLQGTGDEWQQPILHYTGGYFLYDTVCMLLYPVTASTSAFVHHLSIGSAFVLAFYFDCCRPFQFLMLLEELSTPFLNLKTLFKHRPLLADAFALLFAVSFLFIRMGYGMYVYARGLQQLMPFVWVAAADGQSVQVFCAFFQLTMCTASRLLNVYWSGLIVRKLYRAAVGGGKNDSAKKLGKRLEKQAANGGSHLTTNAGGGDKFE